MGEILIYRDAFNIGKFNYECDECAEIFSAGCTLIAATNSAMAHNSNNHYNTLQIGVCKCDSCALAIYQLYLEELENKQ